MAVKIQYRRGNAAAVPNLDIGEPGWDIDVKTARVGDGTASPPRIMTTKSSGSFDYSSVTDIRVARMILGLGSQAASSLYFSASDSDTGYYSPGQGQLAASINGSIKWLLDANGMNVYGNIAVSGTVDGVKLSKLNPAGVHGMLVKTANNEYAVRNLINGTGIAAFRNASGANNPGGVAGDIVVQLADNPVLPGNGAVKVPSGTTGERGAVSPINGHLRYNTSKRSMEAVIDGDWRELVDYVEGKLVQVPSQFPSIQDAIDYFDNRSTKSLVYVQLAVGAHPVSNQLSPSSRTNRVMIQGVTTQDIDLDINSGTPIVAVSGAAGNWQITYKVDEPLPDWLTVGPSGHSVIISDIEGSGDCPNGIPWNHRKFGILENKAQITTPNAKDGNGATIPITAYYQPNDYIMAATYRSVMEIRRVSSIVSTLVAAVSPAFSDWLPGTGNDHRKLRKITGTLFCTNSTTVNGSGTVFTQQLNVGDHLVSLGTLQVVRVDSIISDTQFTIDWTTTIAGGTGFTGMPSNEFVQVVNSAAHMGCFQVTAKNAVDRTITVTNTSRADCPPPLKGIRRGLIKFVPSTILFTSNTFFNVSENEFLGLKNVTVRYTGGSPTADIFGVNVTNGAVNLDTVGFVNAPITMNRQAALYSVNPLAISGNQSAYSAGLAMSTGSTFNGNDLISNGHKGVAIIMNGSSMNCSRVVTHGTENAGMILNGSSQFQCRWHRSTWNAYNAIRLDGQDRVSLDLVDYYYNGAFNMSTGESSKAPAIQATDNSTLNISSLGLILTAGGPGVVLSAAFMGIGKSLFGCFGSHGFYIANAGQARVIGSHIRNTQGNAVYAGGNAFFSAAGHGFTADYGKVTAVQIDHNSFAQFYGSGPDYGNVGFIKRGPLAPTSAFDVSARWRSTICINAFQGSLAQNQLAVSPQINGEQGNVASLIYGSFAPAI